MMPINVLYSLKRSIPWLLAIAGAVTPLWVIASDVSFRLSTGLGKIKTDYDLADMNERGRHTSLQIIHHIPQGPWPHSWGLHLGRHSVFTSDEGDLDYQSVGLMVESHPFKYLIATLGVSGYLGDGVSDLKPFGFQGGMGAAFPINKYGKIIGRFQQEIIFDQQTTKIYSLSIGMQFRIWH